MGSQLLVSSIGLVLVIAPAVAHGPEVVLPTLEREQSELFNALAGEWLDREEEHIEGRGTGTLRAPGS